MQCISPISIKDPNGVGQSARLSVPCGKCVFCLQNRRNEWSFRLLKEEKISESSYFLTLTYNDEKIPVSDSGVFTLYKKDVQDFHKRLRKRIGKKSQFRYYVVGEYGTKTNRPHYHSIAFNIPFQIIGDIVNIWENGHVKVGTVTSDSIGYVTKYLINEEEQDNTGRQKPFAMMSLKPGIGSDYLKNKKLHSQNKQNYVRINGVKQKLPRFYKEKFFTKVEREALSAETKLQIGRDYEKMYRDLKKMGYNPDDEIDHRTEYLRQKLLNKSSKNRVI